MLLKLKLDYGIDGLNVEVPGDRATVIEPMHVPAAPDPAKTLRTALQSPIGTLPLRELYRPGRRAGISVCDITRAQPRKLMLEALFSEMPGVRMDDVTVFIATGTHRRNTNEEIERMVGREIAQSCRIICHNARDTSSLAHAGHTSTGVRIMLNREWRISGSKGIVQYIAGRYCHINADYVNLGGLKRAHGGFKADKRFKGDRPVYRRPILSHKCGLCKLGWPQASARRI